MHDSGSKTLQRLLKGDSRTTTRLGLLVFGGLVVVACGPKDLTRRSAQEILNASSHLGPTELRWHPDREPERVRCGVDAGLWSSRVSGLYVQLTLTQEGNRHFLKEAIGWGAERLRFRNQISREVVEVTGLTDLGGGVLTGAEFTWRYKWGALPAEIAMCWTEQQDRSMRGRSDLPSL